MVHPLMKIMKIGFIGAGNMTQALIKGILESKQIKNSQVYVSNRTPGKLVKLAELYPGLNARQYNEEIVDWMRYRHLSHETSRFTRSN